MSFLDDVAGAISDAASAARQPSMVGVVVGRVINVDDPLFLSRVQVQIPQIDDLDQSPWARVAMPMAGIASGMYWMPNREDEVLVAFENGDLMAPYIVGCLWSALAPPPLPSPEAQIRLLRTPLGNQIMLTEVPPTITITTADMTNSIVMSPAGIQLIAGTNLITMTSAGITVTGTPNVSIVATEAITLTAPNVSVLGVSSTSIGSPESPCNISGLPVAIN